MLKQIFMVRDEFTDGELTDGEFTDASFRRIHRRWIHRRLKELSVKRSLPFEGVKGLTHHKLAPGLELTVQGGEGFNSP